MSLIPRGKPSVPFDASIPPYAGTTQRQPMRYRFRSNQIRSDQVSRGKPVGALRRDHRSRRMHAPRIGNPCDRGSVQFRSDQMSSGFEGQTHRCPSTRPSIPPYARTMQRQPMRKGIISYHIRSDHPRGLAGRIELGATNRTQRIHPSHEVA